MDNIIGVVINIISNIISVVIEYFYKGFGISFFVWVICGEFLIGWYVYFLIYKLSLFVLLLRGDG